MDKKRSRVKILAALLGISLTLGATACGAANKKKDGFKVAAGQPGIVNIGATNKLLSMNPLLNDAGEVMKYATGFAFLPMIELNDKNTFVPQIASSIENKEGLVFTVKLDPKASWSDGQPITADDVLFTVDKLTSDVIANPSMSTWAMIKGLDDKNGTHPDAETTIAGVRKVDAHTVAFECKSPITENTFENTLMRYLQPIPRHLLQNMATKELKTTDWFNNPKTVSGPYIPAKVDTAHFVTYEANTNYWLGAPKIPKLNLRIYPDAASLLPAFISGEVDFVQQTMAAFPQEDQKNLEKLQGAKVTYDKPLTNQLVFLNTKTISDPRARQALLYGVDRQNLLKSFLAGKGEVDEGFLTSYSPYFDANLKPLPYDAAKARALLREAGWDKNKELVFKINSGDPAMVQVADVMAAMYGEMGIKIKVQKTDFNNLMAAAGGHDFDLLAVQYTLAPIDPYPDAAYLTTGENWSQYANPAMDALVEKAQSAEKKEDLTSIYSEIDQLLQKDVPLFNAYVISAPGIVSDRLENAEPHVYGSFLNIEKWELK